MSDNGSSGHQILDKLDAVVRAIQENGEKIADVGDKVEAGNDKMDGFYHSLVLWLVKSLVVTLIIIALGGKSLDLVQQLSGGHSAVADSRP